jgi:hypothetical protein
MTLNIGKGKFKIQKKMLAFFSIVPLLLATALIRVPCPECGGTGVVSATGMSDVSVVRMTFSTQINPVTGCNNYLAYATGVDMLVLNSGTDDANGYITLVLQDFKTGKVLQTQDVTVNVPAATQVEYNFNVVFQVYIDNPPVTNVVAQVDSSNVACKACGGRGTIPLNSWPFVYTMKDSLKATQRIVQPWTPPVTIEDDSNL